MGKERYIVRLLKIIGIGFLLIGVVIFMKPSTTMNTNNEIYTLNSKIEICQMTSEKISGTIKAYSELKESQEKEIRRDYTTSYEEKLLSLSILDAVYETKVEGYRNQISELREEIEGYKAEIEILRKKPGPTQYTGVVIGILGIVLIVIGFAYKPIKAQI